MLLLELMQAHLLLAWFNYVNHLVTMLIESGI